MFMQYPAYILLWTRKALQLPAPVTCPCLIATDPYRRFNRGLLEISGQQQNLNEQ